MKILTLNIWGGRVGRDKVLDFFRAHQDVDIFCLQEVWSAPYEHIDGQDAGGAPIDNKKSMTRGLSDISEILTGHTAHFQPLFEDNYGLLMMVSKECEIVEEGSECVYMHEGYVSPDELGDHARLLQYVTLKREQELLTVLNFHGLWHPRPEAWGKRDIPERIEQSKKIVSFLEQFNHPVVLSGDFNLRPDTESMKIIEDVGLRNLITEYGITSTRTSFYEKPEKYADYTLVSEGVTVKDFKVLPDEVSDHAALYLEIE